MSTSFRLPSAFSGTEAWNSKLELNIPYMQPWEEQALYVLVQLVAHTERVVQFVDQFFAPRA